MEIQGPGGISGPNRMEPHRTTVERSNQAGELANLNDSVQISDQAKMLEMLSQVPDVRMERIQELKEKFGLTYPLLLDTEFEVATKTYGLSGPIPLKVIIDCQGVIRYSHVGDYADGISEVPFVLDELLADPSCGR